MFNQCSLEYFPPFRAMLWACDCPTLGEFAHECELQQGQVQAPWCFLFYAFILCAFWDSLTFPIRRHCLQLLITLLNFVAVWDESLFSRRLFQAVCSGCNHLSPFFGLSCEQLWEKCCFLQFNYFKVYLTCSLKFWHCRAGAVKLFKSEWLGWRWCFFFSLINNLNVFDQVPNLWIKPGVWMWSAGTYLILLS